MKIYRFGRCLLNLTERRLEINGKNQKLSVKTFDVLQLLVENRGKIVTKDELLGKVWSGCFVEEGNLAVHISRLRKLFGAETAEPFIETVSGSGYRFVGKVQEIHQSEWVTASSQSQDTATQFQSSNTRNSSIAVLPLKNESGSEELDHLADRITENIINHLAANPKLKIIARNTVFRYKDQEYRIREIGQTLNVEVILTGRIGRWNDRLFVGVELVNAGERSQIWGLQLDYRFEDIFQIEEKIVQDLLDNLTSFITNFSEGKSKANNESQKLYLKGMYLLENRSLKNVEKAITYFERSKSGDPTNAQLYIALAECYRLLKSYEKLSREEALNQISPLLKKAGELNPELAELHVFKGIVSLFWEFDFTESKKNLKEALRFDPNSANAHYRYAELLIYCGRFSEAKSHIEEYARLNSLSRNGIKNTARLLYFMERFEDSLVKSEKILELDPDDFEALLLSGIAFAELGRYEKARGVFQKSLALQNHSETISMLGYTNALSGKVKAAEQNLRQMERLSKKRHISPINYAVIYSALGNTGKAFECLDMAFRENNSDVIAVGFDPRLKAIRNDRKFKKVLSKLGLPLN